MLYELYLNKAVKKRRKSQNFHLFSGFALLFPLGSLLSSVIPRAPSVICVVSHFQSLDYFSFGFSP